jgi:hypothetical protein
MKLTVMLITLLPYDLGLSRQLNKREIYSAMPTFPKLFAKEDIGERFSGILYFSKY